MTENNPNKLPPKIQKAPEPPKSGAFGRVASGSPTPNDKVEGQRLSALPKESGTAKFVPGKGLQRQDASPVSATSSLKNDSHIGLLAESSETEPTPEPPKKFTDKIAPATPPESNKTERTPQQRLLDRLQRTAPTGTFKVDYIPGDEEGQGTYMVTVPPGYNLELLKQVRLDTKQMSEKPMYEHQAWRVSESTLAAALSNEGHATGTVKSDSALLKALKSCQIKDDSGKKISMERTHLLAATIDRSNGKITIDQIDADATPGILFNEKQLPDVRVIGRGTGVLTFPESAVTQALNNGVSRPGR